MPKGGPHAEAGPKLKLNSKGSATKGKSLHAALGAADYISAIGLVNPASVEYLNRK